MMRLIRREKEEVKMLLIFYIAIVGFASIILYLAHHQEAFPLAYLAFVLFLFTGLMLLGDGVELASGSAMNTNVDPPITYTVYTTHRAADNWIVSAIGNTFFYGSLVMTVAVTIFALRGDEER